MPQIYEANTNSFGGVTVSTTSAYVNATISSTTGGSYVREAYPAQWFVPGESRNPCGEIALGEGGVDVLQAAAQRELEEAQEDLATLLKKRYSFFKKKMVNEVYIEEEE
jgi:hypothetical protein